MRVLSLLLSLVLLAFLPAIPATAQVPASLEAGGETAVSGAAAKPRISIRVSSQWVRRNRPVTVSGKVRGVRGRPVVKLMQKRAQRGFKWHVEASKRATRKGKFRHTEPVHSGSRYYKACVKNRCSKKVLVRMGKPPKPPAQPTSVAITAFSSMSVEAGQGFTVAGTASGNLDGRAVQVQVQSPGQESWGTIASPTVTGGQWSAEVAVSAAGKSVPIRVLFPGASGLLGNASAPQPITVFGWYYLAEMDRVDSLRFDDGLATLAGTSYARSVFNAVDFWWASTPWGEWNLAYSCRTFDALIGLDDESETGFKVGFRSFADSVERFHGVKTTGEQPTRVSFDVTSVFRLKLQDEYVAGSQGSGNGHGWGVWADARVLCAF